MEVNGTLRFGWNVDLAIMAYVFRFQWILEALVFFFLHPMIFMILWTQRSIMTEGVRRGFIVDQIGMIFYGCTVCYIVKMYPLYPWPGFYCGGLICKLIPNIQPWRVMLLSSFAIVSSVPGFQFLTFRIYDSVVSISDSRFYVGLRVQCILFCTSITLLSMNVTAFVLFSDEPEFVSEIYKTPEIKALLETMGGRLVIFGHPGNPMGFRYEVYIIIATMILVLSPLAVMMKHARHVIKQRELKTRNLTSSSRTHVVQDRIAKVFFIQTIYLLIFFCLPLTALLGLMIVDTSNWSPWFLAIVRPAIIVLLSLKNPVKSIIFLIKHPQFANKLLKRIFRSIGGGN